MGRDIPMLSVKRMTKGFEREGSETVLVEFEDEVLPDEVTSVSGIPVLFCEGIHFQTIEMSQMPKVWPHS